MRRRKRYRIGYAAQGQDSSFPREVHAGLARAAEREQVELIVVDNRYQPKIALRNAEHLIRERRRPGDRVPDRRSGAPAIAARYLEAEIPLIAIDIPHPGATYFGANNYEAGLLAGRYLGRWARQRWNGEVDEILLLELPARARCSRARMRGVMTGLKEVLREATGPVVSLDGDGQFKTSLERVRRHLRHRERSTCWSGRPTIRARWAPCARSRRPARSDLRHCRTERRARCARRAAHAAHAAGRFGRLLSRAYGDGLIRLALDLLGRKPVPPAVFVSTNHHADNVDHFYPNDSLLGGRRRRRNWHGPPCVSRSEATSRALRFSKHAKTRSISSQSRPRRGPADQNYRSTAGRVRL